MKLPVSCALCPRKCGADRAAGQTGMCGGGATVKVARAALHHWEEPCLSGTRGSGTVFFSGCALQCCFCQNYAISAACFGKELTTHQLADVFLRLQAQGAHNLNLVTAGHWTPWVLDALALAGSALTIPIVYNTGGYETAETLAALDSVVDIYLTDLKFCSSVRSTEYANAPDYFDVAFAAAKTMLAQTGPPVFDADGLLQRGVIVRHLALPGATEDSFAVLHAMASLPKDSFLVSVMSQYTPCYKAAEHGALGRRISTYEYRKVVNAAVDLDLLHGFMQERSSAKEEYTPLFDLEGLDVCIEGNTMIERKTTGRG